MVGRELVFDSSLSIFEKLYIRIFGAPISGLRIRHRRLMPKLAAIVEKYRVKRVNGGRLSIIDAGCGTGVFSFELAKRFRSVQVIGMDSWQELVEKNTEIAKRAGIENCSFQVEDILSLQSTEEFDLAVCIDNLEHIEDDARAVRNIYNSLKKGGMALFHVPGLYRRWLFFGRKMNFAVKGHVRPGYTLEEIRQKIEKERFSIEEIHYTYGWLETVTNNLSYLITGAERRNKYIYALVFPFLNALAFWGQWSKPSWGAGVVILVRKEAS